MSENSTNEDNSEDEEDNLPTDTPSLMLEISEALDGMSRTEMAVFSMDDSDSDSESTVEYTTPETVKPIEDGINDDKLTKIDVDDSDCDSVSTIEYTAPEPSKPTEDRTEDDEITEINGDDSDSDSDNKIEYIAPVSNKPMEDMTDDVKLSKIDMTKREPIEMNGEARMNNQTESTESTEQNNLEDTVYKEISRGRSRKRSPRTKNKRSVTQRQENTASPPLRKNATAKRNGQILTMLSLKMLLRIKPPRKPCIRRLSPTLD